MISHIADLEQIKIVDKVISLTTVDRIDVDPEDEEELLIENTIIETLKEYGIKALTDRKNIGIWIKQNKKIKKVGAIGIRVKKWIAYHGFSINIQTNLKNYDKIIPCGIRDKDLINLYSIKKLNYRNLGKKLTKNFLKNLKN